MTQGNRWRCLLRNGRAMEPLQGAKNSHSAALIERHSRFIALLENSTSKATSSQTWSWCLLRQATHSGSLMLEVTLEACTHRPAIGDFDEDACHGVLRPRRRNTFLNSSSGNIDQARTT